MYHSDEEDNGMNRYVSDNESSSGSDDENSLVSDDESSSDSSDEDSSASDDENSSGSGDECTPNNSGESSSSNSDDDNSDDLTDQPSIYEAPRPSVSWTSWLKRIVKRIVFPPILLWDGLKFLANYFLGESIGRLVLMATHAAQLREREKKLKEIMSKDISEEEKQDELKYLPYSAPLFREQHKNTTSNYLAADKVKKDIKVTRKTIKTYDGALLDTLMISSVTNINNEDQIYIINLFGNGECYEEHIEELEEDARELKCNVVGFNLRDVSQSKGIPKSENETYGPGSPEELYTDIHAQFMHLVKIKGAKPENIYLKGHSLGAALLAVQAKRLHKEKLKVLHFNGRSFSSITNVIVGIIRHLVDKNEESVVGIVLGWLAKPFIKFGLTLTKWEIPAGHAFKSLPKSHREHFVVRSPKDKRKEGWDDDGVIRYYASTHASIKDEISTEKSILDELIWQTDPKKDPSNRQKDMQDKHAAYIAERKLLSQNKMYRPDEKWSAHNTRMKFLRDRSTNQDANTFFRNFVRTTSNRQQMSTTVATENQRVLNNGR